jgi:hypothetical protein
VEADPNALRRHRGTKVSALFNKVPLELLCVADPGHCA